MNEIKHQRLFIEFGQVKRLGDLSGEIHVSVRSGTLWMTIAGDPRDFILPAGRTLAVRAAGSAVLSGLQGAVELEVRAAVRPSSFEGSLGDVHF